jgi:hypothetical protein
VQESDEKEYSFVGVENSFRSNWTRKPSIFKMNLYPNRWVFVNNIRISAGGDILRDCRKSPKMAILAIPLVMISITYKY